jgi:hypothetical protein
MAFRLARDLGEWNVDAMLDAMPAPLFAEWCEFYNREPASEAFYLGFGILGKRVADMLGAKHAKLEDFMPRFEGTKVKKTGKQMAAIFSAYAHAHNESLKRRG